MMNERDCYPHLEADLDKLNENLTALRERCQDSFVGIIGVVKGVNAWPEVVQAFDRAGFSYLATSRLDQLNWLRGMRLRTPLMMIRVPMRSELPGLVRAADASLPPTFRHTQKAVNRTICQVFQFFKRFNLPP